MTYQGERARESVTDKGRFFEVSKIRLGADGHVSEVLWGQVNSGSDQDVGPRVVAPAAEVVDAIHEGASVVAVFPPIQPAAAATQLCRCRAPKRHGMHHLQRLVFARWAPGRHGHPPSARRSERPSA